MTCLIVASATPALLLGLPPLALGFIRIQGVYSSSARELQRLESVSRSPVYSALSEALAGAATIRSCGPPAPARFEARCDSLVNANLSCYYAFQSANRWLTVRTEGLASLVVAAAAVAALRAGGRIGPGVAGLSISYSLAACSALSWLVRAAAAVGTEVVSVERVAEFASLPPEEEEEEEEKAAGGKETRAAAATTAACARAGAASRADGWPSSGDLVLDRLGLKYSLTQHPPSLVDVSASFASGSRVGVVGRTGSGKARAARCPFYPPQCLRFPSFPTQTK